MAMRSHKLSTCWGVKGLLILDAKISGCDDEILPALLGSWSTDLVTFDGTLTVDVANGALLGQIAEQPARLNKVKAINILVKIFGKIMAQWLNTAAIVAEDLQYS